MILIFKEILNTCNAHLCVCNCDSFSLRSFLYTVTVFKHSGNFLKQENFAKIIVKLGALKKCINANTLKLSPKWNAVTSIFFYSFMFIVPFVRKIYFNFYESIMIFRLLKMTKNTVFFPLYPLKFSVCHLINIF